MTAQCSKRSVPATRSDLIRLAGRSPTWHAVKRPDGGAGRSPNPSSAWPERDGPYISWTRKVDGKTVTRLLTEEQWTDYEPWFANAKRLRGLVAELESLSLREIDNDPRWRQK